jgi:hypothetical protein
MSVPPSDNSPLLPHGGYEKLRSYKVAEAVYDATVVFCNRFIPKSNRTAAKGPSAGKEFWGCSQYPDCRGIMDLSSDKSDKPDPS